VVRAAGEIGEEGGPKSNCKVVFVHAARKRPQKASFDGAHMDCSDVGFKANMPEMLWHRLGLTLR
jgi:hypothetical protein